jgi:hypothetical protein
MSLRRGRDDPADIRFEERQERIAEAADDHDAGLITDPRPAVEMFYSYGEIPDDVEAPVDETRCQIGVVCDRDWIGQSSDPEVGFRAIVVYRNPHDEDASDAHPVLACEDCDGWLTEVFSSYLLRQPE